VRFTKAQAALFRCGISFVHLAPTAERMDKAKADFLDELLRVGMYYTLGINTVYRGSGEAKAQFRLCSPCPEATDHAPVMFLDGKKSEFSPPEAFEDTRYIPQMIDGCGPMVVR
jgi:hypothetical protein